MDDGNASSILDAYDGLMDKLAKLKGEAERMLAPTADEIKNSIAEYNRLAEIAGSASRFVLTETDSGATDKNEPASVVAYASASDGKQSVATDSAPAEAESANSKESRDSADEGNDDSNEDKPSDGDGNAGTDEGTADTAGGGFYAEPARVEDVELVDGSTMRVERYRKPIRRKTRIPEPMDIENIDFTDSRSDPNVIVPNADEGMAVAPDASAVGSPDDDGTADTEAKDAGRTKTGESDGRKKAVSHRRTTAGGKQSAKGKERPERADTEPVRDDADAEADEPDPYGFL